MGLTLRSLIEHIGRHVASSITKSMILGLAHTSYSDNLIRFQYLVNRRFNQQSKMNIERHSLYTYIEVLLTAKY